MATAPTSTAISMILTQNEATAAQATWTFHAVNSADSTDATGKTFTLTISKAGGAFAAPNAGSGVTEIGNGWYKVAHNAADLDTIGVLSCRLVATGVDTINAIHQVSALDFNVATTTLADSSLTASKFSADALAAISVPLRIITRPISGTANGTIDQIAMKGCLDAVYTIAGTFGGGSLQAQTCEDATAVTPAWANSGSAITAAGTITVTGPHNNVRLVLSGATAPAITGTQVMRKQVVAGG